MGKTTFKEKGHDNHHKDLHYTFMFPAPEKVYP